MALICWVACCDPYSTVVLIGTISCFVECSSIVAPGIPVSKHAPTINYTLKSKVVITHRLQLCSTHYTALQKCKKLLCLSLVVVKSKN